MCRIAQAAAPGFEVDDLELRRHGPSYTFDTVKELTAAAPGPIHWLIGADMLQILPKWHRAIELLEQVEFIIMRRPGFIIDWQQLPQPFRRLEANLVEAPLIDISATEIRRRLAAGLSVDQMLPPGVEAYIRQHALYGAR